MSRTLKKQASKPRKVGNKTAASKSVGHYNAILLEEIRSQMQTVIEGMDAVAEGLKKDFRNEIERVVLGVAGLQGTVSAHSRAMGELLADLSVLKDRAQYSEKGLRRMADQLENFISRFENHEGRLVSLESAANQ